MVRVVYYELKTNGWRPCFLHANLFFVHEANDWIDTRRRPFPTAPVAQMRRSRRRREHGVLVHYICFAWHLRISNNQQKGRGSKWQVQWFDVLMAETFRRGKLVGPDRFQYSAGVVLRTLPLCRRAPPLWFSVNCSSVPLCQRSGWQAHEKRWTNLAWWASWKNLLRRWD